ncbi:hypothetical protein [Acinetobacter sp. CFCC 10889]|uniref:hypothetical protein n=1 Tax=Acinetobacter sp. CFCC 10889 TaxID=1775557 RepID=UPI000DD05227|nr:hypothetical protein [Acinetobacter sp. CFCC 10889]
MRYFVGALVIVVLVVGYFLNKSNKEDVERLKQAEITHQQKLEAEKAAIRKNEQKEAQKAETDLKIKALQSKYMMDYLEAKKVIESQKMNTEGRKFYANLASRWSDAFRVAGSTSRVALSQPVKDMQQIKRDLEARQPTTDCEIKLKQELLNSYDYAIDGFLQFMQKMKVFQTHL